MKDITSRIPDFGSNYLQPGCSVIHFYYSDVERLRFVPFLAEGLLLRQAAVIAGSDALVKQMTQSALPTDGRRRIGPVHQVILGDDVETCVTGVTRAVQQAAMAGGAVRVLADFSSLRNPNIFEIEAVLSTACEGLKLMKVTQYDGASVPAPVAVEQFKTHSLTIVGDAFYYENRDYISPETYIRKRAAAAAGR
jgi:hypothetical protein